MSRRLTIIFTITLCFGILLIPQTAVLYNLERVTFPTDHDDNLSIENDTQIDSITESSSSWSSMYVSQENYPKINNTRVTSAPENISIPSGDIDYIIITPAAWRDALDDLVDLRSKSFKTIVNNVENITQYYKGRDDAEKIRNFLQELYFEHSLKFVLLVGDVTYIPLRYVYNPDEANDDQYGFNDTYKPTDLYYSCLNGDWDTDEDGIYGESSKYSDAGVDEIEWVFNVAVGRIPANSIDDVQHYIDKVIHYETAYGEWLNRMLLIGAISNFEWEYPEHGATDEALLSDYIHNATIPSHINITKLYDSTPSYHSFANASKAAFFNYINSGTALVNFAGHGTVSQLLGKTDPDNDHIIDWENYLTKDDLSSFTNTEAYPFFYIFACLVNAIDAKETGGYVYDSLGEQLILMKDSGAIGLVGSMRRSWYEINILSSTDRLHNYLFWRTFFSDGYTRIGECLLKTKDYYLDDVADISDESDRKQLLTYILLGDPALDLLTDQPDPVNVNVMGNASTVYGGQRIAVNVTDNQGDPISYARVSIMNENASVYGTTDEEGLSFIYTPRDEGRYEIIAKGHNTQYCNASIDLDEDFDSPDINQYTHKRSYAKNVTISVNATDMQAGVKKVTLVYHINDTFHDSVTMTQGDDGIYTYSLGMHLYRTNISYSIHVYDGAGNSKKISDEFMVIDDITPKIIDLFFGLKRYDAPTPFEYFIIDDEFQGGSAFNFTALYFTSFLSNETIELKNCNWTKAANSSISTDKVYGEIPKYPFNTTVYYKIIANDEYGNQQTLIGHYIVDDLFAPSRLRERVTLFGNTIKFSVNASEPCNASGVEKVTLYYSTDKKHWNTTIMTKDPDTGLYTVELDRSCYTFTSHFVLYWAIRARDCAGKINDFPQKPNMLFIHLSNIESFILFFLCIFSLLYVPRSLQFIDFLPSFKDILVTIFSIRLYLLTFLTTSTLAKTSLKYTYTFRKLLRINTTAPLVSRGIFQIHPSIITLIVDPLRSLYRCLTSVCVVIISDSYNFFRLVIDLVKKSVINVHQMFEECIRQGIAPTLNLLIAKGRFFYISRFNMRKIIHYIVYLFLGIFHIPTNLYCYSKTTIFRIQSRMKSSASLLKCAASALLSVAFLLLTYVLVEIYYPPLLDLLTSMPATFKTMISETWDASTSGLKSITSTYNPAKDIGWLPLVPRFLPLTVQLSLIFLGIVFSIILLIIVRHAHLYRENWIEKRNGNKEES